MSKSTDSQFESRQGDSRLTEFLRRASPILAAERGWNERSRLKIKSLAEDLNLPDDLYATGVERLQQGDLQFEDRFSTYEQSFIKYLHKQFSKANNSVLTAAHETRAIRIARREYEINQVRARQLVRQVAEQLGMSRVSKLDAVEYVAAIIDEQIGEGTIVPDSVRGRIYETSQKWGVESGQVEILIKNRIEANRQVSVPDSGKQIRIVAGLIAVVIMLGIFWMVQKFVAGTIKGNRRGPPADVKNDEASTTPLFAPMPRWWASETAESFRSFTADSRSARIPHELLKSDRDDDRLIGYQNIIKLIRENHGEFADQCIRMFALFFVDESYPVCQHMIPMISELGKLPEGSLPTNTRRFANSFLAGDLILSCLSFPITEDKKTALDEAAQFIAGTSVRTVKINRGEVGFEDTCHRSIAAKQWKYFGTRSFSQPELAARLIDEFGDLTRRKCGEPSAAEHSTAFGLLAIRPGVWTSMQRTLLRVIDEASDDQLRELYLRKNEYEIPELRSWMGKRLATRLEINTDRMTSRRIDLAIEAKLNLATSKAGGFRPRWQRFNDNDVLRRLLDDDVSVDPVTIGQAVHFATIAMLISQAEKSGGARLIAEADRLFDERPRNLAVRSTQLSTNLPVYRRIQRRALPSDIRTLAESMEKLTDSRAGSDQVNARAFEQLARAAPRIRDVTIDQASMLAAYMLEANRTSELVAIEKFCSQMRHWPNLALALADQLPKTEGTIDQALTCTSVMLGFSPQLNRNEWRIDLRDQVLDRVATGLRHTAEVQGNDKRYQWNELRSELINHYRLRCTVTGIPGAKISGAQSPAELAFLLAESLADTNTAFIHRQLLSNQYLSQNELHLFSLHGRVLAEILDPDHVPEDAVASRPQNPGQIIFDNEVRIIRSLARNRR